MIISKTFRQLVAAGFLTYGKYFLLAMLIYLPLFGHLDSFPIRLWDESRLTMNAYEMYKNGDMIVTHFDGKPDMWNTKPPLLIWIQAGLMKLMGPGELAMRLPSAFAGLFTCALLMVLSLRYLKSFWFGFIAVLVLITSKGYVELHITRTGDYDAMLIFFTTLYSFAFFAFVEKKETKYLYIFFASATLAVLTKSIIGLIFFPGLLIYTIWRRQLITVLKNIHFYIGVLIYLFVVVGYYLLRESNNHGYINQVWENELGGRYLEVTETHAGSNWFFIDSLIDFQYSFYYLFIPAAITLGLLIKNSRMSVLVLFSAILSLTVLATMSFSQTKLLWYDAPIFPFFAIMSSYCIYYFFRIFLNSETFLKQMQVSRALYILLFLILLIPYVTPYSEILKRTFKPKEIDQYYATRGFYDLSYVLRDMIKGKLKINDVVLYTDGYVPHIDFYYNILRDKGVAIVKKHPNDFVINEEILVGQDIPRGYVEQHFKYKVLFKHERVVLLKIIGKIK